MDGLCANIWNGMGWDGMGWERRYNVVWCSIVDVLVWWVG
jgi:hypothetical protein